MSAFTILYRSANAVVSDAVDHDAVSAAPADSAPAQVDHSFVFLVIAIINSAFCLLFLYISREGKQKSP